MPAGELEIRVNGTWKDAYTEWALSLSDDGLSRLMTPKPHKQPVTNKNVTANGAAVIESTVGYLDERTISLPMHIKAPDKVTFWTRYNAFCDDVLNKGTVVLRNNNFKKNGAAVVFSFKYLDVQNMTEIIQQLCKFDVIFYEPNGD